jgi:glycosyltransferase involved in cell wall biosynthesis
MPASRQPLSVAIITLNAAAQLEECLKSAHFADDIVVVDSGSTDGTQALAERYGARIIAQPWLGFTEAVRRQCRPPRLGALPGCRRTHNAGTASRIESALTDPAHGAYRFARCNRFLGRYLKYGEGYPDWSLRLFDRRQAGWSDDAVHEKLSPLAASADWPAICCTTRPKAWPPT